MLIALTWGPHLDSHGRKQCFSKCGLGIPGAPSGESHKEQNCFHNNTKILFVFSLHFFHKYMRWYFPESHENNVIYSWV